MNWKIKSFEMVITKLKRVTVAGGSIFRLILFVFLIVLAVTVPGILAQSSQLSADEQFSLARGAAFNEGNYEKARRIAYEALELSPEYHGIRIFIANLYGWEGNYDDAKNELEKVLKKDPDNRSAFVALINIESGAGEFEQSLRVTDRALNAYPGDEDFMLQHASVLYSYEEYARSEEVYESIMVMHPSSKEARDGLDSARLMLMKNTVSISYRHDQFGDIFQPWNFWDLQLSRQTKYGSVIGRVQYANRFSTNGVQFNVDAYPSIASGLYAYISGGYSNASIYPGFRFGFSLYKSLPYAFEIEGGMRYLNFTTSETYIYTASLTKYRGSYMITGRSYFVPSSAGNSLSGSILVRRYLSSARSYIGVSGGYGTASNDIQFAQEINTLNSWSVSIDSQYPLNNRFLVSGSAGIDSEELSTYTRDRFSFKVGMSYRF